MYSRNCQDFAVIGELPFEWLSKKESKEYSKKHLFDVKTKCPARKPLFEVKTSINLNLIKSLGYKAPLRPLEVKFNYYLKN